MDVVLLVATRVMELIERQATDMAARAELEALAALLEVKNA